MKNKFKEFAISSWAIDNRITIFMLTIVIIVAGMVSFQVLPKENFPEIQWPVIFVSTPYPGTSAEDIENLVSRKIEKELKGVEGLKEINSTSIQDFSSVFVEFETDVDLDEAKREVQEAVDRAKADLPNDLPADPQVIDINLSEIPIMFLNVSGPYDNVTLKRYAEDLQEEIEKLKEILRVDIVGAPEREIQVNVDLYKAENASITMGDIEKTISSENVIISGGEMEVGNHKIAVRLNGEFQSIDDIRNLVVRGGKGNSLYLKDIADVVDGFKERDSYARLNGEPVLTLNVIKKGGQNLVDAADNIKVITEEMKEKRLPEDVTLTFSADQSLLTRNTLNELTNTIIIGFILVTIVLMFFMGIRDALFVGLAVPLSSFIAFATLPGLGYSMNLIVLFSFILAMGIVVDNAIVVIENTYRLFTEEKLPIVTAAKKAAGEVIGPVFAGTLTTICPFLPLLFWSGPVGEFMGFMPVVMIITLFASLFVAYVINPVFAASFMKRKKEDAGVNHKQTWIYAGGAILIGILFHLGGSPAFANFMIFMGLFVAFYNYVLSHAVNWFQEKALPAVKNAYRSTLVWSLDHPWTVIASFLGFDPEGVDVPLGPLNVLIGANGSGKSNFIEAFDLLARAPSDFRRHISMGGGIAEWLWKGSPGSTARLDTVFRNPKGKANLRYHLGFHGEGGRFAIADERVENEHPSKGNDIPYFFYRFNEGRPVLNVKEDRRELRREDLDLDRSILAQRRDPDVFPEITYLGQVMEEIAVYRDWQFGRFTPARLPQKADLPNKYLDGDAGNLGLVLNNLRKRPDIKKRILQELQNLYAGIEDYDVSIEGGSVQVFIQENGRNIPATTLSDGTLRYLCLLVILLHPNPPRLVCLEEPELGLHPDIIPPLADLLVDAAERFQLIVTTHSDTLVNALHDRPESILVCERNSGSGTSLTRLDPIRLASWLEKYRLGELWISGEIGGTRW